MEEVLFEFPHDGAINEFLDYVLDNVSTQTDYDRLCECWSRNAKTKYDFEDWVTVMGNKFGEMGNTSRVYSFRRLKELCKKYGRCNH